MSTGIVSGADLSVIEIHYPGQVIVQDRAPLLEAVGRIFARAEVESTLPTKIVFPSSGKIIYFDDALFWLFASAEITEPELRDRLECDLVVRNLLQMDVPKIETIEKGCLWLVRGSTAMLLDDDQTIATKYVPEIFEIE